MIPRHDLEAEKALLGDLLSIAGERAGEVFSLLVAEDFYDEHHQAMFAGLHRLHRQGVRLESTVLLDELASAGEPVPREKLVRCLSAGGGAWRRYAEIIVGHAFARRLARVCSETASDAGQATVDPFGLRDRLRGDLDALVAPVSGPPAGLWEMDDFLDRPREDRAPWVIPGLMRRGWRAMVVAPEGAGKALAIDTRIPTPKGWRTMAELEAGDFVFDEAGQPCRVVVATDVMRGRPCYRVTFSDHSSLVSDASHQWWTLDYEARQRKAEPSVCTTVDLARTLHARDGHTLDHAVPTCGPVQYAQQELLVDPYVLGVWLGDGTTAGATITSADSEIVDAVAAAGYSVARVGATKYGWRVGRHTSYFVAVGEALRLYEAGYSVRHAEEAAGLPREALRAELLRLGRRIEKRALVKGASRTRGTRILPTFQERLREVGVLGNKHIPPQYLEGAVDQRLALLQGLMDTDGTVSGRGGGHGRSYGVAQCEFSVVNRRLASDVYDLLLGLGIKVTWRESPAMLQGRNVGTRYRLSFQTDLPVFRLSRKAKRLTPLRTRRAKLRYITAVEPVPSVPVKCIQVDSPTGVYLAGRQYVPTHNSTVFRQVAICAAQGLHPFSFDPAPRARTLLVDLENPEDAVDDMCIPIRNQARRRAQYESGRAFLWHRPAGIDIRSRAGRSELEAAVRYCRPELVSIGPVYKAYRCAARENDELASGEAQQVLDDLRTRYGFALLLEHHAPKKQGGSPRELLPYGSSLWLRWPEFGFKLLPPDDEWPPKKLELKRWRGDRLQAAWPDRLDRGREWPWEGYWAHGIREAW